MGLDEAKSGWEYSVEVTERRYHLRSLREDSAWVEAQSRGGFIRTGCYECCWEIVERQEFPGHPDARSVERALLEERSGVAMSVPAGSFTCTYRREAGTTEGGEPALIQTWSDPRVPLPILQVVTRQDPSAPQGYQLVERTQLVCWDRGPAGD